MIESDICISAGISRKGFSVQIIFLSFPSSQHQRVNYISNITGGGHGLPTSPSFPLDISSMNNSSNSHRGRRSFCYRFRSSLPSRAGTNLRRTFSHFPVLYLTAGGSVFHITCSLFGAVVFAAAVLFGSRPAPRRAVDLLQMTYSAPLMMAPSPRERNNDHDGAAACGLRATNKGLAKVIEMNSVAECFQVCAKTTPFGLREKILEDP